MSLKLDLLLEAIEEINREDNDIIEESAGRNGALHRVWCERYKAEKDKNDKHDAADEPKRKMYERAGYGDKAPQKANREREGYAKNMADTNDTKNMNCTTQTRKEMAEESKNFINDKSKYPRGGRRHSINQSIALHDRINKRAEQKKAMGESVEDHINYVNTILELLD